MARRLSWRVVVAAALLASPAGGCAGGGAPPAPAADVPFPDHVGAFERVETPVRGRNSMVAGYQLVTEAGSIIATVQVRPAAGAGSLVPELDIGRGDAETLAETALAHSVAEVRRFYPEAARRPCATCWWCETACCGRGAGPRSSTAWRRTTRPRRCAWR